MATIIKWNGKWKVEIRKSGYPKIYRTFFEHKTALKYAKDIETQMDKNIFEDYSGATSTTLKVLLIKYRNEITINKKGVEEETSKINLLLRNKICLHSLMSLRSHHIYNFKNEFSKTRATATVNKYINLMSHAWTVANGAYDKFKNQIQLAQKKDEELKKKKPMHVLDYVDGMVALHEPDTATDKQKAVLKRIQDENKLSAQRTESNKAQRIPKVIVKKPTSPVEIDFSLLPTHTAGLWSNIKNSSIYKLLDDPKVLGTELGHETIIEAINLLQNSGLLKKGGRVK